MSKYLYFVAQYQNSLDCGCRLYTAHLAAKAANHGYCLVTFLAGFALDGVKEKIQAARQSTDKLLAIPSLDI